VEQETSASWLARWLKSEMFWQGIAVQTLGTLGAALIVALLAIFTGIGHACGALLCHIWTDNSCHRAALTRWNTVRRQKIAKKNAINENLYVESVFETTTDRRPLFRWYTYSCDRRRLDSDYNWARYRPLHRKSD
jgi:hypothetical protein